MKFPPDSRAELEPETNRTFRAPRRDSRRAGVAVLARLWRQTSSALVRTALRQQAAQLAQDVRHAIRMMRRTPGFTLVAVFTLATGIGANTAIFSVVNAVLLRPLPYDDSDRIASLFNRLEPGRKDGLSDPELLDARERMRSVELAAFSNVPLNLTGRGDPERLRGTSVTSNFLQVLGVEPALGIGFRSADERRGGEPVVILTHDLWARLFNQSPAAIGQSLRLDGRPHTVVGVLPPSFVVPDEFGALERSALLVPLVLDPAAARQQRGSHYLSGLARLREGFTLAEAQTELDTLTRAFQRESPGEYGEAYRASLSPIRSEVVGDVRKPLLILLGAVSLVLLIACANVANLLLARGRVRAREIAVRKAIGASHARLARQVITESLVLAGTAAATGLVLARGVVALVVGSAAALPRVGDVDLDPAVLAFTAATAIVTALLFGSLPALHLALTEAAPHLQAGRSGRATLRPRVRAALVAAQVALALVLLVGAGLLVQSFARVLRAPSGFEPSNVLTLRLSVPVEGYATRDRVVRFFEEVLDRVRLSPGVVSAGAVAGLPLQTQRGDWDVYLEGETPGAHGSDRPTDWQVVTPGYFEAMAIRLVSGRHLLATDRAESPAVVVVNEAFARAFFANRGAVGRTIRMSGRDRPWMRIVGVVADVRQDALETAAVPEVYMPHAQFTPFWPDTSLRMFTVVVRTRGDAASATAVVRREVRAVDPALPLSTIVTMEEVVARSVADRRVQMLLVACFGGVALVLALVGTYGVLAYQIAERTREFGVRMALGARAGDIVRLVLREGMVPAAAGVAFGLCGAAVVTRLLSSLLFETTPLDPVVFAGTAASLLVAASVACCVPARRATRIDPGTALRAE